MKVYVQPGQIVRNLTIGHSEVAVHMGVAGTQMDVKVVPSGAWGAAAQLLRPDGREFSAAILLGEAGLYEDQSGIYFNTEQNPDAFVESSRLRKPVRKESVNREHPNLIRNFMEAHAKAQARQQGVEPLRHEQNVSSIHHALVSIFGTAFDNLTPDEKTILTDDAYALARDEDMDEIDAVRELSDRIGGVSNLRSYVDTIVAGALRRVRGESLKGESLKHEQEQEENTFVLQEMNKWLNDHDFHLDRSLPGGGFAWVHRFMPSVFVNLTPTPDGVRVEMEEDRVTIDGNLNTYEDVLKHISKVLKFEKDRLMDLAKNINP